MKRWNSDHNCIGDDYFSMQQSKKQIAKKQEELEESHPHHIGQQTFIICNKSSLKTGKPVLTLVWRRGNAHNATSI